MKTLVLGGYGNFGARIVRALAASFFIELLIGGRDQGRADALALEVGVGARGVAVDWTSPNFAQDLQALGIELLIHTAGPFQQQDYHVARAAAQAGAHYIDLADGHRFVCDFPQAMDAVFRHAGRTATTSASTVPALSSAVVEHLSEGWQSIDAIDLCIAPAQTAPRGVATLVQCFAHSDPFGVAPLPPWQRCESARYHRVSLWFAPRHRGEFADPKGPE